MPLSGGHSLPEDLYSADAVREIDRYVIDQQGVDGFDLMQARSRRCVSQAGTQLA